MNRQKRSKSFTLIEVIIVLVLLATTATAVGIRVEKLVHWHRFQSKAHRLFYELETAHHLAINMHVDWNVILEQQGNVFTLKRSSAEFEETSLHSWQGEGVLKWNDKSVTQIVLLFSATGSIVPTGLLELSDQRHKISWKVPQKLGVEEVADQIRNR